MGKHAHLAEGDPYRDLAPFVAVCALTETFWREYKTLHVECRDTLVKGDDLAVCAK